MKKFCLLPASERADFIYQYATPRSAPAFIVEKDFWVCWLLGRIFGEKDLGEQVVFKGGTSLSKVFGVIQRFSEDIDLSISPASLGWDEARPRDAGSSRQLRKLTDQLEADCARAVEHAWRPKLEEDARHELGAPAGGGGWFAYRLDPMTHSPVLEFSYPQAVPPGTYIAPIVRIEFGSLTDQQPTGKHPLVPLISLLAPGMFADFRCDVVALELERTFWEKATILHAEYHRPPGKPLRDRFARHYADFAALWKHPAGRKAAERLDLLDRVRVHKSRFFASSWANYEEARPGTLRFAPPAAREGELRRDYESMKPMFLSAPPTFPEILATLREAETTLNEG